METHRYLTFFHSLLQSRTLTLPRQAFTPVMTKRPGFLNFPEESGIRGHPYDLTISPHFSSMHISENSWESSACYPSLSPGKKFRILPAPWLPGLLVAGWLYKCPGTKLAFLATLPAHTSCPSTDTALPLISLNTAKKGLLKKILLKAGARHYYNSKNIFMLLHMALLESSSSKS